MIRNNGIDQSSDQFHVHKKYSNQQFSPIFPIYQPKDWLDNAVKQIYQLLQQLKKKRYLEIKLTRREQKLSEEKLILGDLTEKDQEKYGFLVGCDIKCMFKIQLR